MGNSRMKEMKKMQWVLSVVLALVGSSSSAQVRVASAARDCAPPAVSVPYPFQSLLASNPSAHARCKNEASVAPVPEKYVCCVKPQSSTPAPTPFPSGACCKAKPNANPGYDCSLPLLNFGHPQGVAYGYQRCIAANGGTSCSWSTQNRECCAAGIPGCGGPSPTPACNPPNTLVAFPFYSLIGNPQEYDRCKRESAASGKPESYRCCARPVSTPTPSSAPSCAAPNLLIPSPFLVLATSPGLAPEYDRCKKLSAANPPQLIFMPNQQVYGCCVSLLDACNRGNGLLLNGNVCPRGTATVFGPVQEKICCKRVR